MIYLKNKVYRSIKCNSEVMYLGLKTWKLVKKGNLYIESRVDVGGTWTEPHYNGMRKMFKLMEEAVQDRN